MIKRLLLTLLFALSLVSYADVQQKVTFNNKDRNSETINLQYGAMFVSVIDMDEDEGTAVVSVAFENMYENKDILIFNKSYDEKTLKSMSIRFDKSFGGKKGHRVTDYADALFNLHRFLPSEKKELFKVKVVKNSTNVFKLPFYIAKPKGKKLMIQAVDIVELNLSLEILPNEGYIGVKSDCDTLMAQINRETFCTNKNHKGTAYKQLIEEYQKKIQNIKNRIDFVMSSTGIRTSDKLYYKFKEIIAKLDQVNFETLLVPSCLDDKTTTGHRCGYCSMSYKNLFEKLQSRYIGIHNGSMQKEDVIKDVNAIRNCIERNKRRSDDGAKSRCLEYIKDINNL